MCIHDDMKELDILIKYIDSGRSVGKCTTFRVRNIMHGYLELLKYLDGKRLEYATEEKDLAA